MKTKIFVLLALVAFSGVYCKLGLDVAGAFSVENLQCFRNEGFSFVVVRGFRSTGTLDTAATQTLTNAKAVGLATDVYMFPCRGKSPAGQVGELVAGIPSSLYETVWIDIETNPSAGCSWAGYEANSNCQYLNDIINALRSNGKNIGVFSSGFMWNSIFGNRAACPSVAGYPLWYAHYDKSASLADFIPFGGWTKPTMKEYTGDGNVCGLDVNLDYRE